MKNFELPQDSAKFIAYPNWDFTLSNHEHPIEVSLQEIEGLKEDDELGYLKAVVLGVISKSEDAQRAAADSYLNEYNEKWSDGDLLSREEFIARLKIASIYILDKSEIFMEFGDVSDMFWGHALRVRFNSGFEILEVTLEG